MANIKETIYIYMIQNLINGKVYIGQTINPQKRWNRHKNIAESKKDRNTFYLQRSIRKYGIENFSFNVFQKFYTFEEAKLAEIYWIKFFESKNDKVGYNLTDGGEGCLGRVVTSETKEKIRQSHIGIKHTNESKLKIGANNPRTKLNYIKAKEIREKHKSGLSFVSLAREYFVSPENIAKIVYNQHFFDKTYISPEPYRRGKTPRSKETRKNMSIAQLGKNKKYYTEYGKI